MNTIGIIGSGTMGTDIAHAFAQAGYCVRIVDKNPDQNKKAKEKIKNNVRFQKMFLQSNAKMLDASEVLSKIHFSTELSSLESLPFIIENVTEDWEIKKAVHTKLAELCDNCSIIAANTSAIPITRFGSIAKYPQNVIGVHFMNPAHIMPTVELICGHHTSEAVLKFTKDILLRIGKKSILVKDSPGFVTNRAMMIFVNEAIYCLHEGVAKAEDIDTLFKECFGHKMGPLQTGDLIGLDTILKSLEVLYLNFNDDKYRPCVLLRHMVDAGLLGVKSGQGFYEYNT